MPWWGKTSKNYSISVSDEADGITGSATGTVGNFLDIHTPLFLGQLHEHPAVNKWRSRPSLSNYKRYLLTFNNPEERGF